MRLIVLPVLLLLAPAPAAAAWERIGAAAPVASDEERWLVFSEDGKHRT